MASELHFREERSEDSVMVTVSGEVDIYTSQALKDKLYTVIEDLTGELQIDCKELNYIDSTGLGIFVGALKKAKQKNSGIRLTNLKDNIRKLFMITGLDKLFILE